MKVCFSFHILNAFHNQTKRNISLTFNSGSQKIEKVNWIHKFQGKKNFLNYTLGGIFENKCWWLTKTILEIQAAFAKISNKNFIKLKQDFIFNTCNCAVFFSKVYNGVEMRRSFYLTLWPTQKCKIYLFFPSSSELHIPISTYMPLYSILECFAWRDKNSI